MPRMMTPTEIENRVSYHLPTNEAKNRHEAVRASIKGVMELYNVYLPECREKSLAMTRLEESMMWANAAIARNHDELAEECST